MRWNTSRRLLHQSGRRLQLAMPRRCVVIKPDDWQPPSLTYSVPPIGFHDWNYDEKDWQKDPFRTLTRLGIEVCTEAWHKLRQTSLADLIGADSDSAQFVTGHPEQFNLGARENLRLGYRVSDSRPVWRPSEESVDLFSHGLGVCSVDQLCNKMIPADSDQHRAGSFVPTNGGALCGADGDSGAALATWVEANPAEVADEWSGGVPFLRQLLQVDGKLTRCLSDPVSNKRLVIIKGNHNSYLMSRKLQSLIEQWNPDSVVIETDAQGADEASFALHGNESGRVSAVAARTRMARIIAGGMTGLSALAPSIAPLALGWAWFMGQMLVPTDVMCAMHGAHSTGSRVILADWHRAERVQMNTLAHGLDEAGRAYSMLGIGRNYNRGSNCWRIDFAALSQLFVGEAVAPRIPREVFHEFFEHRKENEPHDFYLYEKRNDLLAAAIMNSHVCTAEHPMNTRLHFEQPGAEKLVAVMGAAHVDGVVDRLTGAVPLSPAFDVDSVGRKRVNL